MTVNPRAAALLVRWALRYAAGRYTGVYTYPMAVAEMLGARLTPAERAAIIAESEAGLAIAEGRIGEPLSVSDEPDDWRRFIERMNVLEGEGTDDPLATHGGRALALTANGAVRRVSGYDIGPGEEAEVIAVAEAVAQVAHEFSDSDRVLLMRDLKERASEIGRDSGGPGFHPAWSELYRTISQMPLDEDCARWNSLPESIG